MLALIYKSRNLTYFLNIVQESEIKDIYKSRNLTYFLNKRPSNQKMKSTKVEILHIF